MDRNSAIGLTLIAFLLLAYFYWFSPSTQPADQQAAQTTAQPIIIKDSTQQSTSQPDIVLNQTFVYLATAMTVSSSSTTI